MRFVLYGRHDPATYVVAYMATNIKGCYFDYLELDCDPVLIAFSNGREISRTRNMTRIEDWVNDLVFGEDCGGETL